MTGSERYISGGWRILWLWVCLSESSSRSSRVEFVWRVSMFVVCGCSYLFVCFQQRL